MRRVFAGVAVGAVLAGIAMVPSGAQAEEGLRAGFSAKAITPVGPSPAGWNFWTHPTTKVWSEEYLDDNGDGCFDAGEAFIDDTRNSVIDAQSTGKFDGIWTNAGFTGRCARGKLDDIWARAAVLEVGDQRVALVSLDLVGFFYDEVERIRTELSSRAPEHGVDKIIVSSTHTHEGPDTMGFWGSPEMVVDGKFPLYQAFIRSRVVDAILEATASLQPASMRAATTEHRLGIRDLRSPDVIDPLLQAAQFVDAQNRTLGTLLNWSNHPESMYLPNPLISSDFVHGARKRMEELFGGTAVYFSGSVGGMMSPLYYNITATNPATNKAYGTAPTVARAYYIGAQIAEAARVALLAAPLEEPSTLEVASKEILMPGDNYTLRALNISGIFDRSTFLEGVYTERFGDHFKTEVVSVGLGSVRFQTVPGELFPEIEVGNYGRADCPAADTGRPYEPIIREQWDDEHLFVFGLAQDQLGYIVPGYDFWMTGAPNDDASRPLVNVGAIEKADPCGTTHYEETVSASSVMAPLVTCTIAELAGKDPWNDPENYPACVPSNTTVGPQGTHPEPFLP